MVRDVVVSARRAHGWARAPRRSTAARANSAHFGGCPAPARCGAGARRGRSTRGRPRLPEAEERLGPAGEEVEGRGDAAQQRPGREPAAAAVRLAGWRRRGPSSSTCCARSRRDAAGARESSTWTPGRPRLAAGSAPTAALPVSSRAAFSYLESLSESAAARRTRRPPREESMRARRLACSRARMASKWRRRASRARKRRLQTRRRRARWGSGLAAEEGSRPPGRARWGSGPAAEEGSRPARGRCRVQGWGVEADKAERHFRPYENMIAKKARTRRVKNTGEQKQSQEDEPKDKRIMAPTDPMLWHKVAAVSGVAALGLGTYGAHMFRPKNPAYKEVWHTASLYHLVHTAALLGAPITKRPNVFGGLLTAGIVLFSGTCYTVAYLEDRKYSSPAPLGGFAFIAAWGSLLF